MSFTEIRFTLVGPAISKNQRDLLQAAEQAQVHTFGWPIGAVLHVPEYRPHPRVDGIAADITTTDRDHYQYWALRSNGDFYLFKSLFEETRVPNAIFFNTRIVRATEIFLYCEKLYMKLVETPGDAEVRVAVRYGGLSGRYLQAVGNRMPFVVPRTTIEDEIESEVSSPLNQIKEQMVQLVKGVCSPLFMLFDFFEPAEEVYRQIATEYVHGKVT